MRPETATAPGSKRTSPLLSSSFQGSLGFIFTNCMALLTYARRPSYNELSPSSPGLQWGIPLCSAAELAVSLIFFLRFPFLLFFISILYIIPRPKLEIESHKILHPLHLLGKKCFQERSNRRRAARMRQSCRYSRETPQSSTCMVRPIAEQASIRSIIPGQ